jgi:DNA-binding transcriptional ArsR family regulator
MGVTGADHRPYSVVFTLRPQLKTSNGFPEIDYGNVRSVTGWNFLTNHGRVLMCIAHDPDVRLRDIAARTGVTERTAYGIVTDLTEAGYVVKHKDGRRNYYQIRAHLPLPETDSRRRTIGEILALLTVADDEATA